MKIILDLNNSYNNYHWTDKKELEEYIKEMKNILWKHYNDYFIENENVDASDEDKNRFYDLLDMFESFEVKESDK